VADQGSYYTLGGMRVKLLFQAEKNTLLGAPLDIIWEAKVSTPEASISGNFYKEEDPDAQVFPNRLSNGLGLSPSAYLYQVYFEPATWDTGQDIEITARVRYESLPGYKHYKFSLQTRELYPVTASKPNIYDSENPQAPIQGADVAMLESLLWQLGLSPQFGYSGKDGARIDSNRSATLGDTMTCQNTPANDRSKFYTGWKGQCSASEVSLEGMIRRFQGRHVATSTNSSLHKGTASHSGVDGIVGNGTLGNLNIMYDEYREASYKYLNDPLINLANGMVDGWLQGALDIFGHGLGLDVSKTYTKNKHDAMLIAAGVADASKTRKALLLAWKQQESNNHWGLGFPRTPFRMTEGSGDEFGNLSFSQVLLHYRYGKATCKAHRNSGLNMFDPGDNMKMFALHLSAKSN
jgi:hypothetical protein